MYTGKYPIQTRTDWDSLLSSSNNINEQVETVSSYISFCVENIAPSKTLTIFPNNKPWVTKELQEILKRIFFTGSELEIKQVNKEVKRAKNKAEQNFIDGNLGSARQDLKTMSSVNTAASSPRATTLTPLQQTPVR